MAPNLFVIYLEPRKLQLLQKNGTEIELICKSHNSSRVFKHVISGAIYLLAMGSFTLTTNSLAASVGGDHHQHSSVVTQLCYKNCQKFCGRISMSPTLCLPDSCLFPIWNARFCLASILKPYKYMPYLFSICFSWLLKNHMKNYSKLESRVLASEALWFIQPSQDSLTSLSPHSSVYISQSLGEGEKMFSSNGGRVFIVSCCFF